MNFLLKSLTLVLILSCINELHAQALVNDDCENANEIKISNKGFDFGTFFSTKVNITNATKQKAESCVKELEETGNCSKTVWYKFYIPTTRNVSIKLTQQDSAIPQIFAGFNIYKVTDCNYNLSTIASQLTALNKFGESGNSCLNAGWYLVQVGCKQKAKGEIWIELNVSNPVGLYDSYTNYYDFKTIGHYGKSLSHPLKCTSIDYEEYSQLNDSSLNKSIWISYTFQDNAVFNSISIKGVNNNKCKYRFFNSNITEDSLKSKKPFLDLNADGQVLMEFCPKNTGGNKIYFMQIVFDEKITSVRIDIFNNPYKADDWNTPAKPNVADISSNKAYELRHYFNCNGLLKNHKCKNVIPEYYLRKYKAYKKDVIEDFIDTFKIGAYTLLNVLEDGIINFYDRDNHHYNQNYYYSFYLGDITKNCNLTLLTDTFISSHSIFSYCIKKGIYTLVTSVDNIEIPYYNQNISLYVPKASNIKYNNPKYPEKLPDFNPLSNKNIKSKSISYPNKDTTLIVETLKLKGKMNFHEITILESGDFNIICEYGYFYIFSGSISKGNLKLINGIDYKVQNRYVGKQPGVYCTDCSCFSLPKGDYTVILVYPYPKLECDPALDSIYFKTSTVCPLTSNNEPVKAFPVNGNQDVFTDANKHNLDYLHGLPVCSDCRSNNNLIPRLSCRTQKLITPATKYSYYTFYVEENCELKLFSGNYVFNNYELYDGNVLSNANLLQDTSKIIGPCITGNLICNLEGKKIYTLVLINPTITGNYVLYFTKHSFSKNDYAAHSYDFGHLLDNKTLKSSYQATTCHTNGLLSDPLPPNQSNYLGNNYNIPYKDTVNYKRSFNNRKNLWYTFTVSAYSQIVITALSSTNLSGKPIVNVFRYKGVFNTNFKQALTNNFDSTIKAMDFIANNFKSSLWADSVVFFNTSCGDNRYFVLLEDKNYQSYEYAIKIKNNSSKIITPEGDLCSNAALGNYNSFGKYLITTNTKCHSYGNSVFEETPDETIKSTWFKIKVKDLEKFDLQIRNSNNSEALLRYNMYGGNCKSMTRITNVNDRYSYFTLSCMGSGEYYIQVLTDKKIDADLQFEVNILKPENIKCKPYDFKYPIAQFKLTGGCQNEDTIKFVNLSTRGGDISYQWYLNGKPFSTFFSPLLLRKSPSILDTNEIKLIVNNTSEFTRDTFIMKYVKDTRIYKFKIHGPLNSFCTDTVNLKISTDFPHKINYSWYQYSEKNPVIGSNSTLETYGYEPRWFFIQGESDNCFLRDSFKLNVYQSLDRFNDSSICLGNNYWIKSNSQYSSYLYFEDQTYKQILANDSFSITKAGTYRIYYIEKGCSYTDTFKIKVEPGPKLLKYTDSLYYCNVPFVHLSYKYEKLLHYQWSTGDSSPSIRVNTNGNYNLKGPFSKCRSLDYTVNLKMETIDKDRLKDTIVCQNSNLSLPNPYPSDFKVLVMEPPQSSILSKSYFKRKLVLQKSQCKITDTSMVYVFPYQGKTIDSLYCDSTGSFKMKLDAGNAQTYNWHKNTHTSRTLDIFNYGNYPVSRIDLNGCRDTINFNIINTCPFQVFIPNVFSPNGNLINDNFSPSVSGPFKLYEMTIFNRWGEQLFQTKNSEPWNGHYMNSIVQQGVYWYSIVVYDIYDKPHRQIGSVIVLR